MTRSWTVDTADVLRALPYQSPVRGWHGHGMTLVPTDGCAACAELWRRQVTRPPTTDPTPATDDA